MVTKPRAAKRAPSRRSAEEKKAAADVLAAQRHDIADARELCRKLVAELTFASEESDAVEEAIALAPETDKRRQGAMMRAVSLASRAAVMRDLASATRTLIELERGAFDLSATEEAEETRAQASIIDFDRGSCRSPCRDRRIDRSALKPDSTNGN